MFLFDPLLSVSSHTFWKKPVQRLLCLIFNVTLLNLAQDHCAFVKKEQSWKENALLQCDLSFFPFWSDTDSLAATQFSSQGQSCRRARVLTDGVCHLALIPLKMIRKNQPPKIPDDWNSHVERSPYRRPLLRCLFCRSWLRWYMWYGIIYSIISII